MDPLKKQVIIVTGPTASGKTAVAIALARHFNTEIISADSRQCYRELDIGVARPSPEELAAVPHHFIASHSIAQEISAADFEAYALRKAEELFRVHDRVVMVGGTGLYIKAFLQGFDAIPELDPSIRQRISREYEEKGLAWLRSQLEEKDPEYAAAGEMKNPQRMMRALEVLEGTGHSITAFQKGQKKQRPFETKLIGLDLSREELLASIDKRVDTMMEKGLLDEATSVLPYKNRNALRTVGYQELFDYLEGRTSLPEAVEAIKLHTRQYAKRQITWFKKMPGITWYKPSQTKEMIAYLG